MAQPTMPTFDNIDPENPRQALQPVLIDLPMQRQKITPPMDGPDGGTLGDWSKALWDRGVRVHPELATVKYHPPARGPQHATVNPSGRWVDINEPDPEPITLMDMSANTLAENQFYAEQLHYLGISHSPESEPTLAAAVVRSDDPPFEPGDHSPSTVNGYLMAADAGERRRVIAAEMTGKRREQILRKWQGV